VQYPGAADNRGVEVQVAKHNPQKLLENPEPFPKRLLFIFKVDPIPQAVPHFIRPFGLRLRPPDPPDLTRRRSPTEIDNEAVADEIRRPARPPPQLLRRLWAAGAQGGYPRRGWRHRAAAGAPHEAQPARLLPLALRYRRHTRCRRRRLPHQHPRTGAAANPRHAPGRSNLDPVGSVLCSTDGDLCLGLRR
jgi:hypothetical protein